MGILEHVEDQSDDEVEKLWGRSKIARLEQQKKAMADKQIMEDRGIRRYPFQGTCGICESWHEQVFAMILDMCEKCADRAAARWRDKKIYFAVICARPNKDYLNNRCQMCNKKSMMLMQVNIKMCRGIRCLRRVGKLDHFKNRPEKKIIRRNQK